MPNILTSTFKTPVGELLLGSFDDQLVLADWTYRKMRPSIDQRIQNYFGASYQDGENDVLRDTKRQLTEYFTGERKAFTLPLLFTGTTFQHMVWNSLLNIPYGNTTTYLELSKTLGAEKAIRAVASANGANALSIIVPCHRVIGSDGKLVGYAGGLAAKKKLLALEVGLNQTELFA